MTRPGLVLMGSGYFLMLLTGLGLTGIMHYDFISMFNNLLGLLVGMGVATASLAVLVPGDRMWRPSRAQYHLLGTLSTARRAPLTGLPQSFEAHVRDLTLQLIELRPPAYDTGRYQKLGLLVLETGDAILRIRRHLASVTD